MQKKENTQLKKDQNRQHLYHSYLKTQLELSQQFFLSIINSNNLIIKFYWYPVFTCILYTHYCAAKMRTKTTNTAQSTVNN